MLERLCVCVRPRPDSSRGRLWSHTAIHRPDGTVWHSPNTPAPRGLPSWDILWVDPGEEGEAQLRTFLQEDSLPREILISGPCGALQPDMAMGFGYFANEVLDPGRGPHTPRPPRALSLAAVSRALGGKVHPGKFLTTAVPCVTPNHKKESGHGYGAHAVDQDSALLCRPCHEADVGHAVVKFVLDPMEIDLTLEDPKTQQMRLEACLAVERSLLRVLLVL